MSNSVPERATKGSSLRDGERSTYYKRYYAGKTRILVEREPFHAKLTEAFSLYRGSRNLGGFLAELATPAIESFIERERAKLHRPDPASSEAAE